jgi:hypothetical protein
VTHPTLRATWTALAALAVLAACGKKAANERVAGPLPPGTHEIPASDVLPPPVRTAACYSSPIRFVFHSQDEWEAFWADERRGCTAPPIPTGVDFKRDMLVFAAMGKRMAPQDSIAVAGTGVRHDTVVVAIRRWMLMDGCPGPRRPTFPTSLVKIPADARPLVFAEEHRRIPCEQGS